MATRLTPGRRYPRRLARCRATALLAALLILTVRPDAIAQTGIVEGQASAEADGFELEYVDFDQPRGTVRLEFGDVRVAGGTLRMPVAGAFTMRPSRQNPARRTEGKFSYTYSNFTEVPSR